MKEINYYSEPRYREELKLKQTVSELGIKALSEFKVGVKINNRYVFYKCN